MIRSEVVLLLAVATSIVGLLPSRAAADGDAARGAALFESCTGCHGIEGYYNVYPSYRVPKLGGQNAAYVSEALKSYQRSDRNHPTMHANASSLTEQDIADIASYVERYGQ